MISEEIGTARLLPYMWDVDQHTILELALSVEVDTIVPLFLVIFSANANRSLFLLIPQASS